MIGLTGRQSRKIRCVDLRIKPGCWILSLTLRQLIESLACSIAGRTVIRALPEYPSNGRLPLHSGY
jgi:hypothetical protein